MQPHSSDRAALDQMQALLELADDALIAAAPDGAITAWSRGAERLFGFTRAEILGRPFSLLALPDDPDAPLWLGSAEAIPDPTPHRIEARLRARDGTRLDVSLEIATSRDAADQPMGVAVIVRPVAAPVRSRIEPAGLTATHAVPGATITVGLPDDVITGWDEGAERVFGWTAEEAIGDRVVDFLCPPDLHPVWDACRASLGRGETLLPFRTELVRRDGTRARVTLRGAPVRETGGDTLGLTATLYAVEDGTDPIDQLRLHDAVLSNIPDCVIATNLDGVCTYWNAGAAKLFGYQAEEVIGQSLTRLYVEEPLAREDPSFAQVLATGEYVGAWQGRRKNGALVWIDAHTTVMRDVDGRVIGFVGVSTDATERRRVEAEREWLLEREQQARRVAESAQRHLAILAQAGEIVASSLDPEETLQRVADLLVPQLGDWCSVRRVTTPGGPETAQAAIAAVDPTLIERARELGALHFAPSTTPHCWQRVLHTRVAEHYDLGDASLGIVGHPPPDASCVAFLRALDIRSVIILPLIAHDDILGTLALARHTRAFAAEEIDLAREVAGRCALSIDNARAYAMAQAEIVERGRIAAELRRSNERLEAALEELRGTQHRVIQQERLRALGQMSSGIAHDLNQSLTLISGYSELAQRELALDQPDTQQLQMMLSTIGQAALDGGETIKRLLTFARSQAAETTEPIDVGHLLSEVARLTAPSWRDAAQAQGRPITLSIVAEGDTRILGSMAGLREALTNLVMNAVDALPTGGSIRLAVYPRADRVIIEVADTGVGIPPETLDKIFEPFYTTKGERGTGLGLAQVQGLVARLGGEVKVASTVGVGTTFRLNLPAIPVSAPASPAVEEARGQASRPCRILAVEDERAVGELIVRALGLDGHTVDLVASADNALERLAAERYDVLLSDVGLGASMNGWELSALVRAQWPDLPIILATGWGATIDPAEAQERGIAAVLAKPYRLRELRAAIAASVSV